MNKNDLLMWIFATIVILLAITISVESRMELHCENPCGGGGNPRIVEEEAQPQPILNGKPASLDLPRRAFAFRPFQFRCNGTLYTFEYTPIYAKVSGLSPKLHLFSDNTFDLQECKIEYTYKNRYIWLNEAR